MNRSRLVLRGLSFYWRTNLGVLLGTAVGTTVISGALIVGDSVTGTLQHLALQRLGEVRLAMATGERVFRDALAGELAESLGAKSAAVLQLSGIVVRADERARANDVQVLGIDESFRALAPIPTEWTDPAPGEVILNERLARRLDARPGDVVLLRVDNPGTLPRDMAMSSDSDASVVLRAAVRAIAADDALGRFSLRADQIPPHNAFVSRAWLQKRVALDGQANLLLVGPGPSVEEAGAKIPEIWRLADAELEIRALPALHGTAEEETPAATRFELRSRRVFLDPTVDRALANEKAQRVLTYFINELRAGARSTPYSMVSAVGPGQKSSQRPGPLTADLADDQIVINQWLADDLGAKVADPLELTYFVARSGRQLVEKSAFFTVGRIVPISGPAADRNLMPAFPGLAEAEHCRDWEPGIEIHLDRIRPKDEQYWNQYRGTPKAFVTLRAGRSLWSNRFGDLTALRFESENLTRPQLEQRLLDKLQPASFGLMFRNVRAQALRASADALDFGQLFLSLSVFLLVAAFILTGLLFVFGVQQRSRQVGTLLALGFAPKQARRLLLLEGAVLAVFGSLLGCLCGVLYTQVLLEALATVWRDAVGAMPLSVHIDPTTLAMAAVIGILLAIVSMQWTLGRLGHQTARQLLSVAPGAESGRRVSRPLRPLMAGVAAVLASVAMLWFIEPRSSQSAASIFFAAGALLLLGGLAFCCALLSAEPRPDRGGTAPALSVRNAMRQRGRSLATVAILACGVYLVVAVGANRLGASPRDRASGTGGFALFGRSTLPVLHDLNEPSGRAAFDLEAKDLAGATVVSMRVRDGDDASCLNLNRAQIPRLVGVPPEALAERVAFVFARTLASPGGSGWDLLSEPAGPDDPIPAVADKATVIWALGKSLGDTLTYTDERGGAFDVRIVGLLVNSILQGNILIAEGAFEKRFPGVAGHRMFLIDEPTSGGRGTAELGSTLCRALSDVGLELTPTVERLAALNAVQNTYLSIFQALGGLGLVLGSIGLGMVVLRNVLERRSELAVLRALGFTRRRLQWLVLGEHGLLLVLGLACGAGAAVVTVVGARRWTGDEGSLTPALLTLLAVGSSGLIWIWLATTAALRGPLLGTLRRE